MSASGSDRRDPNRKIRFQLLSDLHLEDDISTYSSFVVPARADYLFLAGDIGSLVRKSHLEPFAAWLAVQCGKFKRVFYVGGNHEFWNSARVADPVAEGTAQMRRFATQGRMRGRLVVLQNEHALLDADVNISVLGCVLWSRLRRDQPSAGEAGRPGLVGFTQARQNERFEESLQWIRDEVARIRREDPQRRILVLTHYAPTVRYSNRPDLDAAGDRWSKWQSDILGGEGVEGLGEGDVWAYGHTHYSNTFYQDEVHVISNQRGRLADEIRRFDVNKVFEM
ncbi:uncharacterized protein L3040_008008 [Drepanopeziza brunnea f. sp. 'multigermtubi']|uniref:uncharacterized protein n=1 Tax=Drepanopeziza brunnea f. sp. 'multigermtubi' TaxID=698441 RepID=UPI0023A31F29|nr:hypothetical protein L3040_008008 [Drepanopeziza brunnea f. sp. 'multigermtubi']